MKAKQVNTMQLIKVLKLFYKYHQWYSESLKKYSKINFGINYLQVKWNN